MSVKNCVNCGDVFTGRGDLCSDCIPVTERETEPLPPAQLRGRAPLPPSAPNDGRCPHCAAVITWDNVQRYERRHPSGHREVAYYCPACRAVFELAAWLELPPRKPTPSETRHRPSRPR